MPSDHESITIAPTATRIPDAARGGVLVCGSHGGVYVGYLVARAGVRAVIVNDAGIGLDGAGIGALDYCQALGMAAAAVAADSARIGDAEDMLSRGRISHANAVAEALGVEAGISCSDAASLLTGAPMSHAEPGPYEEARRVLGTNSHGLAIVCVDSVSLVRPEDTGQVVVSGSHGALVAGQPGLAIRVDAAAAFFNDAGIGIDQAGVSRLPLLQERGIPAATVTAASARIGDALSTYETGVISRANASAEGLALTPGMRVRDAVEQIGGADPVI
jgi:uncharacterized protein YunC (DUF1805 family)